MVYFKKAEWCLRYLLLVMCAHPFAKEALTLHLARSEGHELYFGCNLMHRKVLVSSHQHLVAEAPEFWHRTRVACRTTLLWNRVGEAGTGGATGGRTPGPGVGLGTVLSSGVVGGQKSSISDPGEQASSGHQQGLKTDFTSIALPILSQRVAIFFFADDTQTAWLIISGGNRYPW